MSAPYASSSPTSSLGAQANHALKGFVELRSKGVGLDMVLKSACWTLRLVSALSEKKTSSLDDVSSPRLSSVLNTLSTFGVGAFENEERQQWANTLVSAIIDERMMFNLWKWMSTGNNALRTGLEGRQFFVTQSRGDRKFSNVDEKADFTPLPGEIAVSQSPTNSPLPSTPSISPNSLHSRSYYSFRSVSVKSPQKQLRQQPKGSALEIATWFFTFVTYFLRTFEQAQGDIGFWNRFWFTNWDSKKQSRRYKFFKSLTLTASLVVETLKIIELRTKLTAEENAASSDPFSSPTKVAPTPVGGCPSFEYPLGITDLRTKLRKSLLLWIRNVGDMIIYYQWLDGYKPNKVLCSLCGMYSGMIGVYLVWTDNRDSEQKRLKAKRIEEANQQK